jgi:hypothetical protein
VGRHTARGEVLDEGASCAVQADDLVPIATENHEIH